MAASSSLIRNAKGEVLAWASHRLGTPFREPCIALGVVGREGRLIGAIVYNDYDARNVEMTAVGVFRRDAAREIFSVAFDELQCRRISLTVPAKHEHTIRKAQKWGWEIEGLKRNYYDNDDAVIMGMTREECRFI